MLDKEIFLLYKALRLPTKDAQVAQLVEQRTENPRVGGSIPSPSTISKPPFEVAFFHTHYMGS